MSLLVILSTYAMEDGQTATSVPHQHTEHMLSFMLDCACVMGIRGAAT